MLRLMSFVVFIRPEYCGDIWYIPRTLQRTRKPLCYQHTWYRFYDEMSRIMPTEQFKVRWACCDYRGFLLFCRQAAPRWGHLPILLEATMQEGSNGLQTNSLKLCEEGRYFSFFMIFSLKRDIFFLQFLLSFQINFVYLARRSGKWVMTHTLCAWNRE